MSLNKLHKDRSKMVQFCPPSSPVTRHTSGTVKKWVISVKKRSSFECSINHLRRTAGKTGQVSFGRVRCGCRIEILGARAKRGAKTAMKPDWEKALVGNSDPMAGRAHPPTSDVGVFVRALPPPTFQGHHSRASAGRGISSHPSTAFFFRSSLVIFGHVWSSL